MQWPGKSRRGVAEVSQRSRSVAIKRWAYLRTHSQVGPDHLVDCAFGAQEDAGDADHGRAPNEGLLGEQAEALAASWLNRQAGMAGSCQVLGASAPADRLLGIPTEGGWSGGTYYAGDCVGAGGRLAAASMQALSTATQGHAVVLRGEHTENMIILKIPCFDGQLFSHMGDITLGIQLVVSIARDLSENLVPSIGNIVCFTSALTAAGRMSVGA